MFQLSGFYRKSKLSGETRAKDSKGGRGLVFARIHGMLGVVTASLVS